MRKSKLCPHLYYSSIYTIDLDNIKSLEIKGLIIDLDNTILPHQHLIVSEEIKSWFKNLIERGFKVCVISNNSVNKVKKIAAKLQVPFIFNAVKPLPWSFRKATKILSLDKKYIAIVGDQMFTDILGGNWFGIFTILVKPMNPYEHWWTRKLRRLQKKLLNRFISKGELKYLN